MREKVKQFEDLHHQAEPLLIGNVWNAQSAKVFEGQQFKAIATSSAAVAATLGYPDGEAMPFEEYFQVIKSIARSTALPLSVDLEAGYGKTPDEIVGNIRKLASIGIVGINIEDTFVVNGKRNFFDAKEFAAKLKTVIDNLKASETAMFMNVRCDSFLLGLPDALAAGLDKMKQYETTGAHGLFFPCVTKSEDVAALVKASALPINVLCMPGLPSFGALKNLGVKRISMGNFLNAKIYERLADNVSRVVKEGKFDSLF